MNIRLEVLKEHSKKQTLHIAKAVGNDPNKFAEVMRLFFANEYRVTQRIAAVVNACFTAHPELLQAYLKPMLQNLSKPGLHDAVKRNTVRILQFVEIPEALQGLAYEQCMHLFLNHEEPIAVKVFAMQVMENICHVQPELSEELMLLIREQMPYGSTGFCNRGSKIIKRLEKLIQQRQLNA